MSLPNRPPAGAYLLSREPLLTALGRAGAMQARAAYNAALAAVRSAWRAVWSFWDAYPAAVWHALSAKLSFNERSRLLAERRLCARRAVDLEQALRQELAHLAQLDGALSAIEEAEGKTLSRAINRRSKGKAAK